MLAMPQPNNPTAQHVCLYDAWNRLVTVLNASAQKIAEYEYDGLNRRIVKSVYQPAGTLNHRQHFYYNEDWQALEVRKETSGTEDPDPLEQFVYHPYYIDAVLCRFYDDNVDGAGIQQHYYAHDANFNVTAVRHGSSVQERYRYSPYGAVTVLDADFSVDADGKSDIANPYTFTGRRFDEETGLYYYRNRYYHAQLGGFVSRDPIAYAAGDPNLYRYVFSNPTYYVDSQGTVVFGGQLSFQFTCVMGGELTLYRLWDDLGNQAWVVGGSTRIGFHSDLSLSVVVSQGTLPQFINGSSWDVSGGAGIVGGTGGYNTQSGGFLSIGLGMGAGLSGGYSGSRVLWKNF
jgi:RHS repeat-associated protein